MHYKQVMNVAQIMKFMGKNYMVGPRSPHEIKICIKLELPPYDPWLPNKFHKVNPADTKLKKMDHVIWTKNIAHLKYFTEQQNRTFD